MALCWVRPWACPSTHRKSIALGRPLSTQPKTSDSPERGPGNSPRKAGHPGSPFSLAPQISAGPCGTIPTGVPGWGASSLLPVALWHLQGEGRTPPNSHPEHLRGQHTCQPSLETEDFLGYGLFFSFFSLEASRQGDRSVSTQPTVPYYLALLIQVKPYCSGFT